MMLSDVCLSDVCHELVFAGVHVSVKDMPVLEEM